MIFEFKPIIKNNNEKNKELSELLTRLNKEINKNKEEISNLKSQTEQLNCENKQLTKEINDMKNKETQLISENAQIISDNSLLKNEVNQLKEKLNILWKERSKLTLSKIINGNTKYSDRIKNWINSSSEIETELLYRLSENGDSKSLFHELCDNKGPTLTLFHVNDGNIVGIYTPLSWDSSSNWKKDMDTFIFNLNKNKICKKLKTDCSIYCNNSCGPWADYFGCDSMNTMKSITHWANKINEFFEKGSEILPSNNKLKQYNLIETEVYKIIFE